MQKNKPHKSIFIIITLALLLEGSLAIAFDLKELDSLVTHDPLVGISNPRKLNDPTFSNIITNIRCYAEQITYCSLEERGCSSLAKVTPKKLGNSRMHFFDIENSTFQHESIDNGKLPINFTNILTSEDGTKRVLVAEMSDGKTIARIFINGGLLQPLTGSFSFTHYEGGLLLLRHGYCSFNIDI